MSGRATGGRGLGRFIRKFEEEQTVPLFLRILPKKYHKDFEAAEINENILHTIINNFFEGMDIRDELSSYLDMPPRFRFVNVKETKPLYEKLCKEYKKINSTQQVVILQQKQKTPVGPIVQVRQKQKTIVSQQQNNKIKLKCICQKFL